MFPNLNDNTKKNLPSECYWETNLLHFKKGNGLICQFTKSDTFARHTDANLAKEPACSNAFANSFLFVSGQGLGDPQTF